ncbi:hypothetical protein B484DRAFT_192246 [Ochromonadaceae sp. CCMP2298]|nr:hypothetical protein B484DRAFT_192246 [Ochromonadaceae sp. CCMP2298]|mmetsp:Transcript_15937/g.35267  ORF Transcript_15937/g.35267 Transcript_15937/m.35267 type:complete len:220 (-) Transcript_15937:1897-2556(-)
MRVRLSWSCAANMLCSSCAPRFAYPAVVTCRRPSSLPARLASRSNFVLSAAKAVASAASSSARLAGALNSPPPRACASGTNSSPVCARSQAAEKACTKLASSSPLACAIATRAAARASSDKTSSAATCPPPAALRWARVSLAARSATGYCAASARKSSSISRVTAAEAAISASASVSGLSIHGLPNSASARGSSGAEGRGRPRCSTWLRRASSFSCSSR